MLTRGFALLFLLHQAGGQVAEQQEAAERAIDHARRAGSRLDEALGLAMLARRLHDGPMPAPEAVRILERLLDRVEGDPLGGQSCAPTSHL